MRRKSQKQSISSHQFKQNFAQNNQHTLPAPKNKLIKKSNNHTHTNVLHPLQQNFSQRNPQQLHNLCLQQQKLVLAEYRQNRMSFHQQFYEYVKDQLGGSKICNRIMLIKSMTNQEAIEQYSRIQQAKIKYGTDATDALIFAQSQALKQQDVQQKVMFKGCGKKMSMIQQNDDVFLKQLDGGDRFIINQEQGQTIQDDGENIQKQIPSRSVSIQSYYQCQYYQNDDVFEF